MTRIDSPRPGNGDGQIRRKAKPVSDETVILSGPGVHITPVRAVIGDQLFAVANITSVTVVKKTPGSTIPIIIAVIGAVVGFCGIVGLMPMLGPSARANVQLALQSMSCTIGGVLLLLISWYIHHTGKPRYILVLRSAGGESQVYSSTNRVGIDAMARALNDAILARG